LPLFLAKYGKLRSVKFGPVLETYPRAMSLTDPGELGRLLEKESHNFGGNENEVRKWIEMNAGPLPAEQMPERVAAVIESMIHETANGTGGKAGEWS